MSLKIPGNRFCPNCSTLLHPVEKSFDLEDEGDGKENDEDQSGLYLVCSDCSYNEKTITFSATHFSKKIEKSQYIHPKRLVLDYVYDNTYKRTKTQPCVNNKCPSKGKDNPEIVLITNEEHPEIAFLCTVCKNIWGKI